MRTRAPRALPPSVILLALTASAALAQPATSPTPPRPQPSYLATKAAADRADQALEAVSLWQTFVDNAPPNSPDLPKARAQLSLWTDRAKEGAERIGNTWVKGPERDDLIARAAALESDARDLLARNQTLPAIDKLKESFNLYPNSYSTAVLLGYTSLVTKHYPDALKYFDRALALQPNSPDVLNNLAFVHFHQSHFELAILKLYESLQISDDKDRVQNLVTVIDAAPRAIERNPRLRPAIDAARLLKAKYDISGPAPDFKLIPPPAHRPAAPAASQAKVASATGFLVTPDGYILTNRHVVQNAQTILILLPTGQKSSAALVATDPQNDLALLHIKTDVPLPHLRFADTTCPDQGAPCTVLGYPLIDRLGPDAKIVSGLIAGSAPPDTPGGADLLLDAKINPGDSGGPVFDPFGRVIAVVSRKSRPQNPSEDSYGLAISAGRACAFLNKNNITPATPPPAGDPLKPTDVAATAKPATVCILVTY